MRNRKGRTGGGRGGGGKGGGRGVVMERMMRGGQGRGEDGTRMNGGAEKVDGEHGGGGYYTLVLFFPETDLSFPPSVSPPLSLSVSLLSLSPPLASS